MEIPPSIRRSVKSKGGAKGLSRAIPRDKALERRARVHGALSDPHRLRILGLLCAQPLCPCLLKEITRLPDSKLSYHLSVLKDAGLIEGREEGNWIVYRATRAGRKYRV